MKYPLIPFPWYIYIFLDFFFVLFFFNMIEFELLKPDFMLR